MKKNMHWFIAIAIFCGLVGGFYGYDKLQEKEYQVLCLGDSIIGNVRDESSVTALIGVQLGKNVYNGAFGGTTLAKRNKENRRDKAIDCISLVELAKGVAYQDFSVQNASITRCASMDYFLEAAYDFNKVNIDKVQIIVIEHGVNDYLSGVPLYNPEDRYDPFTFAGALRTTLELLMETYPSKKILLCTPTYCWFKMEQVSCEEREFGYGYLEDYVNMEIEIASEYNIDILDNYHDSGIGGSLENMEKYTEDGLHLNEEGRKIIAERIAAYIQRWL